MGSKSSKNQTTSNVQLGKKPSLAAGRLSPAETPMYEEHLCLWFLCPAHLKALLVLKLTEGSAAPVPMDCLRTCTDLWTPDLRDCIHRGRGNLDDRVVMEAVWLCPDLSSLDVSDSSVTDTALKAIASACRLLIALNVRSTRGGITDEGIKVIAASCPGLSSLDVRDTCGQITDEGLKAIAASCPGLTSLNVRFTGGKITDEGIKAIATSCPGLSSLDVGFTRGKISDEGLKAIAVTCKVSK